MASQSNHCNLSSYDERCPKNKGQEAKIQPAAVPMAGGQRHADLKRPPPTLALKLATLPLALIGFE